MDPSQEAGVETHGEDLFSVLGSGGSPWVLGLLCSDTGSYSWGMPCTCVSVDLTSDAFSNVLVFPSSFGFIILIFIFSDLAGSPHSLVFLFENL